ncbi:MAG: hypothetical protein GVY26_12930 [Bacteroidetes bacterium]|nr:hypothetical protein [Bacteroidota bacterium]
MFKKLTKDIWAFRTKYQKNQYRLFAFWDKRDKEETLAVSTHGMIKKTGKVHTAMKMPADRNCVSTTPVKTTAKPTTSITCTLSPKATQAISMVTGGPR